jgi:hypothetical protein
MGNRNQKGQFIQTHGLSVGNKKHPLYRVYSGIKERCYNPNNSRHHRYGNRGISMCKEWLEDNATFFKWAFTNGYEKGLTLERINNDGNYCPSNCKWATQKEQASNRSHMPKHLYKGKEYTGAQIEETFGIKSHVFRLRVRRGWDVIRAIETPTIIKKRASA